MSISCQSFHVIRLVQGTALAPSVSPRNSQRWKKSEAQNSWNDTRSRASSRQIWERYFIGDDLKVKSISVTAANHVELITAELSDVVAHSVYKPPSEQFVFPPLEDRSLPQIVIGDFHSHNTIWGYDATYNNGVAVVQWAESNSLTTEIFQQCKMEKRLQPRPHLCIFHLW